MTTTMLDKSGILVNCDGSVAMGTQSAWIIGKQEAVAEHGMVTTMHPLASRAGLEMLEAGGNAVDAAVAVGFAIGVVEPFMSGVGGVACLVHYRAADRSTVVIDGSTTAPLATREDMFELLDPSQRAGMYGWRATKDDAANTGYRAAAVPGTPACLLHALESYGTMPRSTVLGPAIRLAEEGFELDWYVGMITAFAQDRLRAIPTTMRVFFKPDGLPWKPALIGSPGERLVQPDLGRTLRILAEQGPDALYRGEIADAIIRDMEANGGLITHDDLARYAVREFRPGLELDYRGYRLVGVPETAGTSTVFQGLNILEQLDLAGAGLGSARAYHLIAEASRRAFLDRFEYLADPSFAPVPWQGIVSKAYAAELAAQIDPNRANPEAQAGDPWAHQETRPLAAVRGGAGGEGATTHLSVVDKDHNMVALTSTLGLTFGCGVVADGTGILLNSGMTWFNPEPGTVNSIAPGKRILWAIAPTLLFRDDRPFMAVGAPGGRRVMTAVLQSIVNAVDFGTGMQDAVSLPGVHCEGPVTEADSRIAPDVLDQLRAMGHTVEVKEETFATSDFARPNGVIVDLQTGRLRGGVNQFKTAWAMDN